MFHFEVESFARNPELAEDFSGVSGETGEPGVENPYTGF
jgi:hypothetical protein